MRLRQSTLTTWMTCPLQAKFKHFDGQPSKQNAAASFGTVMHYCLDQYNNGVSIDEAVRLFKHYWTNPEELNCAPDYWPRYSSFGKYMEKGVDCLVDYHNKNRWENRQIIATEHRFLVPFGEHELEGTVDLVELKKAGNGRKTLRIVDYKTNAKQPSVVALRFNIQFTVYIYASLQPEFWLGNGKGFPAIPKGQDLFDSLKRSARKGVWYQLMANKEIDAGSRDDGDYMRLYRLVKEIEKATEADVFVPNISGDSCVYCDYTTNCGIKIPEISPDEAAEL